MLYLAVNWQMEKSNILDGLYFDECKKEEQLRNYHCSDPWNNVPISIRCFVRDAYASPKKVREWPWWNKLVAPPPHHPYCTPPRFVLIRLLLQKLLHSSRTLEPALSFQKYCTIKIEWKIKQITVNMIIQLSVTEFCCSI